MVQPDTTTAAMAMAPASLIRRPLRDLFERLPSVAVTPTGALDYAGSDPDLLVRLAESAELGMQILHGGFASVGFLYAATSQQVGNGDMTADHPAALGRLLVELGEVLACFHVLAFECRRHTADYIGGGEAVACH